MGYSKRERGQSGHVKEGLKGDLSFRGIHPLKEKTIIDVRVFHLDYTSATSINGSRAATQTRQGQTTAEQLARHEQEKNAKYQQPCHDKGYDFVPFVVTTNGAMAPGAERLIGTLAKLLSEKWCISEGVVTAWIRARFAMAIARASSACMRGNRTQPYRAEQELEADFDDGAGLDRLLDKMIWGGGGKGNT